MNEKSKMVNITEPIIQDATRRIWNYTIGFLKLDSHDGYEEVNLLGSGVLVKANDVHAILTAQHVVKVIPKNELIGLVLSNKKETPKLDTSLIKLIEVAKGDVNEIGPDLALIILPLPVAKNLEAKKSFYNLTMRKDKLLKNPPEENLGMWSAQGFVEELTKMNMDNRKSVAVKIFCQFGAVGGIDKYEEIDKFDYYNFPIDIELQDLSPKKYGGTSGGGLWQVTLKEDENKKIDINEVILRGINFYQFPLLDGQTGLRCHGYKSIYNVVYEVLSKHTP